MVINRKQILDRLWHLFLILFTSGSIIFPATNADTQGPIKVTTDIGSFVFPREFVAAGVWKTLKIPPFETNYFLFRLPSNYAESSIQGFAATENHFKQNIVVTVEALTEKRQAEMKNIDSSKCRQASHDLYPQSVPYKRCEYRKHFSPESIAIKYHLNGENNLYFREVEALIRQKLNEWKIEPRNN
jgi:hypothetical protein